MKDVLDNVEQWHNTGHRVALARVVAVIGSGPRDPDSVVAEALEVLASGEPRLYTFAYSDEEAFSVGLTRGGALRIFVEMLDEWTAQISDLLTAHPSTQGVAIE